MLPSPFAGYSGPTEGTQVPAETPNTLINIPVAVGQVNTWFGISDLNANTVPVGGQSVLTETSKTGNATWSIGGFPGGSDSFITSLTPGKYDIGFSLTISNDQGNVNFIVALGTHSMPGGGVPTFTVGGTPIIQPQLAATKLYNVAAFAINDDSSESPNLASRGGLTVTSTLNNVGLIAQVNKEGNVGFSNINMTITRVE